MLKFDSSHWSQEISEVTGQSEYQTCTVRIVDPSKITTEYNIDTAETTEVFNPGYELYSGQARVIPVRRSVNYEGASQNNSKSIVAIRVQIPGQSLPSRIQRGVVAEVTDAPYNRTLESYQFYLVSDVHGSSAATRTLEFNIDGDSVNG